VVTKLNQCFVYSNKSKRPEFKPCAILKSFKEIHSTLIENPTIKVNNINTATSFDVEKLQQVNGEKKLPANGNPECLHVLINKNYSRRADNIALASTSGSVTYAELGKRSAAIAHLLTSKGVRAGGKVGLCMERSVFTIVAIIGILRAGAAYAPMDPSYPVGRISQVVERAEIEFVVTEDKLYSKFQDLKAILINATQLEDAEAPKVWREEENIDSSKPAYLMFTSGSTGLPKGVIHGHGSVSLSILECIEELSIDTSARFMQSANLAFDASILEVFAPLAAGGCLCMVSQEERNSDLESAMEKLKVSHAWLTPSLVLQIQPENLPSLRSLGVGGEPASAELVSTWGERVELNNLYGTTEAGVWDTVKRGLKPGDNPKNIGRGIGNVACWIADPSNVQRLMPFGAEGELLIQSPYLAIEYLKDPDRQKQAILDPSSLEWAPFMPPMEGSRVYRTGDLAKYNESGDVIYLGRQTGYVKIRGLRVDLGEVENAINSCLKSGRSAVILSGNNDQDTEIVAFVETTDYPGDQLATELSDQLSDCLPKYMIPAVFLPIETMPLTLSKKTDRQQLCGRLSEMCRKNLQAYRKGGSSISDCSEIPETRKLAIEISNLVADIFEGNDSEFAASIRKKNFSLVKVGLTSMQLVSFVNLIRKKYKKKINIEHLQRNDLTVCNIEDFLTGRKGLQRQPRFARNLIDDLAKLKPKLGFIKSRQASVFLTSITGFLGSQVLRSLLEQPEIKCVIGLVRASDEEQAQKKVQHHGELGRWWKPEYQDRIECWTGDLSKPKLGLGDNKWEQLFSTDPTKRVDGIIHNAARVNWMDSYEDLELVNVHSTVDILSELSKMQPPCPLIYISGGYMPMKPESDSEIAKRLSEASGYDQTKFMSQLLLTEYNKHLDRSESKVKRARTVVPGFIVGTKKEGIAHTEDFIWRLAFIIVRLKAVSQNLQYFTMAGVDQVSNLITDLFLQPEQYTSEIISCVDSVTISTFCDVLSKHMRIQIKKMNHQEWMELLKKDVEEADFDHPFMPILSWFEENTWQFECDQDSVPENRYFSQEETVAALDSSVRYMMDVGYLSHEPGQKQLESSAVFSRPSS
jgi:amino acid adenylation domain-containing protein/thioester reductase-like protein